MARSQSDESFTLRDILTITKLESDTALAIDEPLEASPAAAVATPTITSHDYRLRQASHRSLQKN